MYRRKCVKIATANRAFKLILINKGDKLAKPNFQFEKRQKELAKKKKQEEKKQRKLEEKSPPSADQSDHVDDESPST